MSTIPRLVISAPSSGHGKTAVSVGLLAALSARGYRAAGFKIGPDHVDAAYLGLAAGRPGRNLDPRMVGAKRMGPLFAHGAGSLDIAVVEGTMGLFDGLAGRTDSESTAQISGLLRAPVILVVDVGAMGQSVAALVHGFRAYDELLWLGGVILNRVASTRHEQLLREALDDIGVPVLGALRRHALTEIGDAGAPLPSRHHGVAPVVHHNIDAVRAVRRLGEVISGAVDIDRTMALARSAPRLTSDPWNAEAEVATADASDAALAAIAATRIGRRPIIGVAFAYPETAELLRAAGADVVPFDPLRDEALPDGVDGLVVGAALPESYAEELTFNGRLRSAVAAHVAAGKPIAAEGAGLVWLCRDYNGRPMCGVVDASARETDLVVLGYREATARSSSVLLPVGTQVIGHKMHRTSITPRAGLQAAWTWAGGPAEGFVQRGVHASYLGLHWAGTPSIASRFVAAASATAAPAPGVWTTPPASPYGRPSLVPAPTAPAPTVGHAAVGVASTLPLPGTPATTPVTAIPASGAPVASAPPGPFVPASTVPASAVHSPFVPTSPAAGPFVPGAVPAAPSAAGAAVPGATAPTVPASGVPQAAGAPPHGPLLPGSMLAGATASAVPASGGPLSGVPASGVPYPSAQASSIPGVSGGTSIPGVSGGTSVAGGVPANAPTSPGASSPFGPALGPALPTPWSLSTSSSAADPGTSVPGAAASGIPVPGAASSGPAVAGPAAPSSGGPGPAVSGPPAPGFAVPGLAVAVPSVPDPSSAPVSGAAVPGAPVSGAPVPGSSVPGAPVSGASAQGASVSGPPSALLASGLAASGPWSSGPSVSTGASSASVPSGASLASSPSVAPVASGASGAPGASGSAAEVGDDDLTTVLPTSGAAVGMGSGTIGAAGVSSATGTGGASVGVPSSSNGPAQGGGLPSSGVVPTTVSPSPSMPSTDARPPTPMSRVSSIPTQPVSTPPAASRGEEGRSANPAISAAMPVSSAPMAQVNAPVSAAPAGVTAMLAAGSDLVADEGSHYAKVSSQPGGEKAADLAERSPVSAPPDSAVGHSAGIPPVSAPPDSAPPVSAPPGSGAVAGGTGSAAAGDVPPGPSGPPAGGSSEAA